MKTSDFAKGAGLLAVIIIISKLAEFGKDIITANVYGISGTSDAYFYALQIPLLTLILFGGLGGPIHKATIKLFSELISNKTRRPKKEAQDLLNSFITFMGICSLGLSIIVYFFSTPIISLLIPAASPALQVMTVNQLQIMSPVIFIAGIISIFNGLSNIRGVFLSDSLGSAIASIAFIAMVFVFKDLSLGIVLAIATLTGVILQFYVQLLGFLKSGLTYKPKFNFTDRKISGIGKILLPAMFVIFVGQAYIFVDMFFAAKLAPGSWSAIYYANSVLFALIGLIILTLQIFLPPILPELAPKNSWSEFKFHLYKLLSSSLFIALPVTAFIMIFSQDLIQLIFQRGKFSGSNSLLVSQVFICLSLSIIPLVVKDAFIKIFNSINSIKAPFMVTITSLLLKIILNIIFVDVFHLGINGIAISTTVSALIDSIALALLLEKKVPIEYEQLIYAAEKVIKATLLMAGLAFAMRYYLNNVIHINTDFYLTTRLVLCLFISCIVYFIAGIILKIHTMSNLYNNIKNIIVNNSNMVLNAITSEVENVQIIVKSSDTNLENMYRELETEKHKTDSLLENILPENVAEELKHKGRVEPVHYESASVMFSDFEDFTRISKILSADELVRELDECFKAFDRITEKYKLEKIKTIGDSYMCVGGIPQKTKTHAIDCVLAAHEFLQYVERTKMVKAEQNLPYFNIRIGINTGELVAGVVGHRKSAYDVWGDTVNLASRMESSAEAGKINISESTYELIKDLFDCTYRGEIEAKNIGKVRMYFVESIKQEFSLFNNNWIPNKKFGDCYKVLMESAD